MQIKIKVTDPSGSADELLSLYAWLKQETEIRGRVDLPQVPPGPDEMGAISDVLVVALGSGGTGTVLLGSIATWLKTRRSNVRLTLKNETGREIEITADRLADPKSFSLEIIKEFSGE